VDRPLRDEELDRPEARRDVGNRRTPTVRLAGARTAGARLPSMRSGRVDWVILAVCVLTAAGIIAASFNVN
jgi:hypothetical protein